MFEENKLPRCSRGKDGKENQSCGKSVKIRESTFSKLRVEGTGRVSDPATEKKKKREKQKEKEKKERKRTI